jgi:hypothetical protein
MIVLQQSDLLPELLRVLLSILECMFVESWPAAAGLGRCGARRSHLVGDGVVLFLKLSNSLEQLVVLFQSLHTFEERGIFALKVRSNLGIYFAFVVRFSV